MIKGRGSSIKNRNTLLVLIFVFLIVFSVLYGFQIIPLMGTDYGIYYVGAMSTNSNYALYQGFFETKGPLFYGFIKLIGYLVPYSVVGAAITLSFVLILWLVAIIISSRLLNLTSYQQVLGILLGISSLISMPTNACTNIFMGVFYVLALGLAIRFRQNQTYLCFLGSIFFSICALLTKLDGLGAVLMVILILSYRNIKGFSNYAIKVLVPLLLFVGVLVCLLQKLLFFTLHDYWEFAFVDVFTKVWNPTTSGSLKNFFIRDYTSLTIVMSSGIFFIFVLLYSSTLVKSKLISLEIFLVTSSFSLYMLLGSNKDYHLFIIYPGLITACLLLLKKISLEKLASVIFISLASVVVLVTLNLIVSDKCLLKPNSICTNRFSELISVSKVQGNFESVYFMNQGWPFLLSNTKPKINFTAIWYGWDDPNVYSQIKRQSLFIYPKTIWIDMVEIDFNKIGRHNFILEYFPGRHIGTPVPGTTFYPLLANN